MYGYVYLTENKINGKKYIGQHKSSTFDKTYKGSGKNLLKAISKYGFDKFETYIIEECDDANTLNIREAYWIEFYKADTSEEFYNLITGGGVSYGDTNPSKRPEVRKILSEKWSGENNPMYGVEPWNKGLTKENNSDVKRNGEKISKSLKGKNKSEEHKKNISEAIKKWHQTRNNMSEVS